MPIRAMFTTLLVAALLSCHGLRPFKPRAEDGGQAPPATLVAHWRLDGNAEDALGRFHGSVRGGALFGPGRDNQAIDLTPGGEASKAHVLVMDDAPDDVTPGTLSPDSLSVALWIRGAATQEDPGARSHPLRDGSGCLHSYYFDRRGTELFWGFTAYICEFHEIGAAIDPNEWQHVVGTLRRSEDYTRAWLRLYVNGELADRLDLQSELLQQYGGRQYGLTMGLNREPVGSQYRNSFRGHLDDVRIYQGILSATQVADLFASYSN